MFQELTTLVMLSSLYRGVSCGLSAFAHLRVLVAVLVPNFLFLFGRFAAGFFTVQCAFIPLSYSLFIALIALLAVGAVSIGHSAPLGLVCCLVPTR